MLGRKSQLPKEIIKVVERIEARLIFLRRILRENILREK
jgi:hypothetical protein